MMTVGELKNKLKKFDDNLNVSLLIQCSISDVRPDIYNNFNLFTDDKTLFMANDLWEVEEIIDLL